MSKLILTAGHHIAGGRGTGARAGRHDEALLARRLVGHIGSHLDSHGVLWLTEEDTLPLGDTVDWLAAVVRPGDVLVDVHFNAATLATASGTEVYHAEGAPQAHQALAAELSGLTAAQLGIRDRGAKPENLSQHRRLAVLHPPCEATALLWEVAFLTNEDDMAAYGRHEHELAKRVALWLMNQPTAS